jgi:hypothetical protein
MTVSGTPFQERLLRSLGDLRATERYFFGSVNGGASMDVTQ